MTRELSGVLADAEGVEFWVAGGLMRLDGAAPFDPFDSWLRRVWRRSNSDPRDTLVPSETLGEDAWGAGLVMLPVPIRLPMLLLRPGLPTSEGCGKELRALSCVFGEKRKVLGENEFERGELVLGVKLRGLGVLGVKLGAGVLRIGLGDWLTGGLNEGREPMDGLEGMDGAAGRLNEGLG